VKRAKNLLMEFQPVWGVELFNLRYNYFCFEPIVIFVFLDFVFYEYSSFNSSQEFFLHFGIWKNHSKTTHFSLILRTKNLVKFGTQQKYAAALVVNSNFTLWVFRLEYSCESSRIPSAAVRRMPAMNA